MNHMVKTLPENRFLTEPDADPWATLFAASERMKKYGDS